MYSEKLRESVGGVISSFILENWEVVESDLTCDLQFVTQSIIYLMDKITEKKDLSMVIIFGEKSNFVVSFHYDYIVGVLLSQTANIHLLNLVVRRILGIPGRLKMKKEQLYALEKQIPFLDKPREEVLSSVPRYAREVLEIVDGKRTVHDIIEQSHLPPDAVIDILVAYRKSALLHYKG